MSGYRPLLRLQQVDSKVAEVEEQLRGIGVDPQLQAVVLETKERLASTEDVLRKQSVILKNLELDLSTKETHKKQLEQKLFSGKTNNSKELTGFQQEIEMLSTQKGQLEEQILELMDQVDEYKKTIQEQKYLLGEQEKHVLEAAAQLEAQRQALAASLQEWTERRHGAANDVEATLLKKYDIIRGKKDGLAVARVNRGTCGVCGMALAPQSRTKLQDGQLETCKNCGRMLVGDES